MLRGRRRGFKTVQLMLDDMRRQAGAGFKLSLPHLFNILRGDRAPNECVLKYLGGSVVERQVEYRIERPTKARAKSKGKR